MPYSKAPFRSSFQGFVPATPGNLVTGTAPASSAAVGNYGLSLGNSATVKMQFPVPGVGYEIVERLTPYEQYNQPKTKSLNQASMTVYYSVAGAALTSMTIGVYATAYGAAGGVVTTLLAQALNGLSLAVGTYAVTIKLTGLPSLPIPVSQVVVELDAATPGGGTAIINGIAFN